MDFTLTDEQINLKNLAKDFTEKYITPHALQWDEEHIFPIEIIKKLSELGFAGLYNNSNYGGTELSKLAGVLIFIELSKGCPSLATYLSIHNMASNIINNYGSDKIKKLYLPKLNSGELLASYCLTEPNSGSDSASLQTSAHKQNNFYILNGTKSFISGGSTNNIYIIMARTNSEVIKTKGISCFLVDKNTPGIKFGNPEKKLGWNNQVTTAVFLENCKIPAENLIGPENYGFNIALNSLNSGRVNIAACAIGGASYCIQKTIDYCKNRSQFDKKLINNANIQFNLATMATDLEIAKLMTYRAAVALDNNDQNKITYCAMTKLTATELCFKIVDKALQMHGGYGYLKEYGIEKYFRDLRAYKIIEGTNEIMKLIIAKQIVK